MKTIQGDLLDAKTEYIGHQCNTVTFTSKGLARIVFFRYPDANTYTTQTKRDPGTCSVHGRVVNLYAQQSPGRYASEPREEWFAQSLEHFASKIGDKKTSLGLPYNVGCGLAGGNWTHYETIILNFSERHLNIEVTLYKL